MNVQEGEAWNLLITFCFVVAMNFNNVLFELDCKMIVDKINIVCEDLIELKNIIVECRKILVTHSFYGIRFVKRQTKRIVELTKVTLLFPSSYSIDNVIHFIKHLIHNEMILVLFR